MSILTLGSKKKKRGGEGKFPIKEEAKKERRKISNQRKRREEREFPIKEWEKAKRDHENLGNRTAELIL